MSNPFLAEIRIFTGNFAPKGWALCDGQLMSISQNTALFSLLGITYGGDGKTNFALPNLQGSAPIQAGQGPGLSLYDLGETSGSQTVTLLDSEMPAHTHTVMADPLLTNAKQTSPQNNVPGNLTGKTDYTSIAPTVGNNMSLAMASIAGGNQPHNNMMPFLGLTFIIALQGVFPARS
jgi:microcystin-dependent protein